ncbi:MAG: DUF4340 domain-containing protein [Proteobacteria bacterium]|nr:DUF4340 domain-containing protein [Pseudomonadota bacterium]
MSKRNLIIAAVILGIVAISIQYFSNTGKRKADSRIGSPLANADVVEAIDEIVIENFTSAVHVRKRGDQWLIEEMDGFPCDMQKLIELLDKVTTHKIASLTTKDPERLAHFKVRYKEEKSSSAKTSGTQLILKGEGKEIFKLISGRHRDSVAKDSNAPSYPDGTYVRIGEEAAVYLIKENLELNTKADHWIRKVLVNLEKDQIKAVRYETQKARFALERPSKEKDLNIQDLGENEKIKDYERSGVLNELKSLSIQQIVKRTKKVEDALQLKSEISVELFDTSNFAFQILSKTEIDPLKTDDKKEKVTYYIKVLPSSSDTSKRKWPTVYAMAEKWLYEIDEWQAKKWLKSRKDFVALKDEKKQG